MKPKNIQSVKLGDKLFFVFGVSVFAGLLYGVLWVASWLFFMPSGNLGLYYKNGNEMNSADLIGCQNRKEGPLLRFPQVDVLVDVQGAPLDELGSTQEYTLKSGPASPSDFPQPSAFFNMMECQSKEGSITLSDKKDNWDGKIKAHCKYGEYDLYLNVNLPKCDSTIQRW